MARCLHSVPDLGQIEIKLNLFLTNSAPNRIRTITDAGIPFGANAGTHWKFQQVPLLVATAYMLVAETYCYVKSVGFCMDKYQMAEQIRNEFGVTALESTAWAYDLGKRRAETGGRRGSGGTMRTRARSSTSVTRSTKESAARTRTRAECCGMRTATPSRRADCNGGISEQARLIGAVWVRLALWAASSGSCRAMGKGVHREVEGPGRCWGPETDGKRALAGWGRPLVPRAGGWAMSLAATVDRS